MAYFLAPWKTRDLDITNTTNHSAHTDEYWEIRRVTLIGGTLDLALGILKIIVGLVSNSHAMVADGIHSFSDLASDLLVIAAARHAAKGPDQAHPYGHGRIQTAASVLLAVSLVIIALGIVWDSISRLGSMNSNIQLGHLVIIVAGSSALLKECVYRYTISYARKLNSQLLQANAWHSRSDALSSLVVIAAAVGALVGIPWADPIAAIVVAALIMLVAWRIGRAGFNELIDTGVSPRFVERISTEILKVEGVREMHQLRTRKMGSKVLADVHIHVDPRISVSEGHRIGDAVADKLESNFSTLRDVIVHIDPEDDDNDRPSSSLPLRSEIETIVTTAIQNLQTDGIISLSEFPSNIVIHYLEGKLSLELWIPLSVRSNSGLALTIETAITNQFLNNFCRADVIVIFAPKHL